MACWEDTLGSSLRWAQGGEKTHLLRLGGQCCLGWRPTRASWSRAVLCRWQEPNRPLAPPPHACVTSWDEEVWVPRNSLPLTFQAWEVHQAMSTGVPAGFQTGGPAGLVVPLALPVGVVVVAEQG